MKKRSLIVATAMLLVAILASTGATYAWFTRNDTTQIDSITMAVDTASGLRISGDPAAITAANIIDDSKWFGSIDSSDISDFDSSAIFTDLSTVDGQEDFYVRTVAADATETFSVGSVASFTVYFRAATADQLVALTSAQVTPTVSGIANAVRIGTVGGANTKIFGTSTRAGSRTGIADSTGATGTQTVIGYNTQTNIVSCATSQSGYYYGTLQVNLWLEGTDAACIDANSGGSINVVLNFGKGV